MPWRSDPVADDLTEHYRRLIWIRRQHPALTSPVARTIFADGSLYAFVRKIVTPARTPHPDPDGSVLVVVNNGDEQKQVSLPFDGKTREVEELLSRSRLEVSCGRISLSLAPYTGAIITAVRP